MKNELDLILVLISIFMMFGGIIWRLAAIKASLEQSIDASKDLLIERIRDIEHNFAVHQSEYIGKRELIEYRLHGHDELINHKFGRCWDEIKQMQSFMAKDGFVSRDKFKTGD